jgi:hypothetical protein
LRRTFEIMLIAILLLAAATAARAQDETVAVQLGWESCGTVDDGGRPCAVAVRYEVFLQRGGETEERIATVDDDTTYTLAAERGVVQRVRVVGYDADGRASEPSEWSDPIYFEVQRSAEDDQPHGPPPTAPTLRDNYPNPFNPETSIVYGVPDDTPAGTRVLLEIYNLRGQRVRRFAVEDDPGWHEVSWNGTDDRGRLQPTGLYVTRFVCGDQVQVGKMTMMK